jgi:hypothetical protein
MIFGVTRDKPNAKQRQYDFIVCSFIRFLLAIVLSVFLRFTASDYPFGIFKLFFNNFINIIKTNESESTVLYEYKICTFYNNLI